MHKGAKPYSARFSETREEWSSFLSRCINPSIFSTYEWGEFKKTGWMVHRVLFFKGETFVGMTQIFLKKLGPYRFGWSPSGINYTSSEYVPGILAALPSLYDLKKTLIRFNFLEEDSGENAYLYNSLTVLQRARTKINSGYTIHISVRDFSSNPSLTSNHRYYLKKALAGEIKTQSESLIPQEFIRTHNSMTETKNLENLRLNIEMLASLKDHFQDRCMTYTTSDQSGSLSACLVLKDQRSAFYYLAGATQEGRKKYASYAMVNALVSDLAAQGIEILDFGGINPFDSNASGVDRFKIGFGGKIIQQVGERDICKSGILIRLFDLIVKWKLKAS